MRTYCYVLLFLFISGYALANMRQARHMPAAPSSFLEMAIAAKNNASQHLEVQKEQLTIDCSYHDCEVDAVYYIHAQRDESLQFEFILPHETAVSVNINGLKEIVTLSAIDNYSIDDVSVPVHKALFYGHLNAGDNFIQINYLQRLGIYERALGYFIHSRFIERFSYFLGPLKEWQLADGFTLNITLSSPQARPKRDGWGIFRKRSLVCLLDGGQITKKNGKIIYYNQLGRAFPDRLVCDMGDNDLLDGK